MSNLKFFVGIANLYSFVNECFMMTLLDMNDMISMASRMFSGNVLDKIKQAKFCMNDIYNLTREDVDHEFREYRFGIRKSLWTFFQSVMQQNDNKQVDEERILFEERMLTFSESENYRQIHEQISSQPAPSSTTTPVSSGSDSGSLQTFFSQVGSTPQRPSHVNSQEIEETVADEIEQSTQDENIFEHLAEEIEVSDQYVSNIDDDEGQSSKAVTPIHRSERKSRRHKPVKGTSESRNTVEEISPCYQDGMASSDESIDEMQSTEPVRKRRRTKSKISKLKLPFTGRPKRSQGTVVEITPCYPEGVTYPFPFSPEIKNFLTRCEYIRDVERGSNYFDLLREIYFLTEIYAVKELTRYDWRAICQGLCWEYPNLLLNGAAERLYLTMRKKASFHLRYVEQAKQVALDNVSEETGMKKSTLFKPLGYPSSVPFPFPLSAIHKKLLNCGTKLYKNGGKLQTTCHNAVGREVCWTLHRYMPKGTSKSARRAVAESLCAQYPALQVDESTSKHPWGQFSYTMRKCHNNSLRLKRSKMFQQWKE